MSEVPLRDHTVSGMCAGTRDARVVARPASGVILVGAADLEALLLSS